MVSDVLGVGGRATRLDSAGGGSAPAVLWLHDTLGNRWSAGHQLLSRSFRVLAPSLPGVDDSTTLGRD